MEKFINRSILMIFLLLVHSTTFANEDLTAAFQTSYELENNGDFVKAINALTNVYNPDSYEINLRLGWLNYQKGKMDESIDYYKRAVELKPYAIEPKLGLAYPYSSMAMWNEIIGLYEKILKIDPQNSLVNYRMGLIYYNRGEHQRADPFLEKTVNLYPFDYDSLLLFAWNKLMLQRNREAIVLFQKVLLANPGDESASRGLDLIK